MYQINSVTNELVPLATRRFSELGFTERGHLQEWIAKFPAVLGEELLIIQKEFDGFDETRERLDLLAIDKNGSLVLIENKLDDSGRDVVWQALKYASYCSSLSRESIANIFQDYLNKYRGGGDAKGTICEFLEKSGFEEVVLNPGSGQRIILVASYFRKEVTCTALWLLNHKIRLQCFKATAFVRDTEAFLNMEQIIPPPDAQDFMIGISDKEREEQNTEQTVANRVPLRLAFWEATLAALEKAGVDLFKNVSPGRDHWLNAGSGVSGMPYTLIFSKSDVRVELTIARSRKDRNKYIFDLLHAEKAQIDAAFGEPLDWQRLNDRKSSRISFRKDFDGFDKSNWPAMIAWLTDHIKRLEKAIDPHLITIRKKIKSLLEEEDAVEAAQNIAR